MQYVYHYHLIRPLKDGSQNHHFGILIRNALIDSEEQYQSAMAFICKKHKAPLNEVIVSNVSLLSHPA